MVQLGKCHSFKLMHKEYISVSFKTKFKFFLRSIRHNERSERKVFCDEMKRSFN